MKTFARGCLEFLIVWGLLGYLLFIFFKVRFEPPGEIYGAAAGGFLLAACWGLLRNAVLGFSRLKLLRRAKAGMLPQDGQVFAVSGRIHPIREGLKTPFKGEECVSYGYSVTNERQVTSSSSSGSSTHITTHMGGYAVLPCVIRSTSANVKILGFPLPDNFPESRYNAGDYRDAIIAYIKKNNVKEETGVPFAGMFTQIKELLLEDDGTHQFDWRSGKLLSILDDPRSYAKEQFIPVGAEVSAIGTYSAQKGGLLSRLDQGGLEILPGDLSAAAAATRGRLILHLCLAIFMGALGSFGAFGILTARELRDSKLLDKKLERVVQAIKAENVAEVEKYLSRGVDPNQPEILEALTNPSEELLKTLRDHGLTSKGQHRE